MVYGVAKVMQIGGGSDHVASSSSFFAPTIDPGSSMKVDGPGFCRLERQVLYG